MLRGFLLFLAAAVLLACGDNNMHLSLNGGLGVGLANGDAVFGAVALPTESLVGTTYSWYEIGRSETIVTVGGHSEYFATDIADLGPRGRNFTSTIASSQSAKYEPGSFNGLSSVAHDGGNDYYFASDGLLPTEMLGGNDKSFTFWWVGQFFITGTDGVALSFGANASTPLFDFFTGATNKFRVSKNSGVGKTVDSTTASDTKIHWVKFRVDPTGTQGQLTVNGVVVQDFAPGNFDTGSVTFTRAAIGALWRTTVSTFLNGRWKSLTLLSGAPNATQEAQMDAYCASLTAPQTAPMLLINGDSLSTPDRWPTLAATDFPGATIVNTSVPGQTLYGFGAAQPYKNRDTLSIYDPNRVGNVNYFGFGTNDLVNAQTGASVYANHQAMVTAIRAAKPLVKIILCTIGWRSGLSASEEAQRQALNSLLRSDKAGADYLLDRDLIITPSTADQALLSDGTHPDALGQSYYWNGRNGSPGLKSFINAAGGF